jgi:glycosyltransferase involved in cell wall biosynthesis
VQRFSIGIMPLLDRPFERGKSGFKLIQYMACGLPVMASPVGVNSSIVEEESNGFLATSEADWEQGLRRLIADPALRQRLGAEGRKRAVASYSLAFQAPRLVDLFREVAGG